MKKKDVGVITIGQSPRTDMTEDMVSILGDRFNIIEKGALDDFDIDYVRENLFPDSKDTVLVSRMRNGEEVKLSEEKIIPLVQQCIYDLENMGCTLIALLCTGEFPELNHNNILIYPERIVHHIVEILNEDKVLGIIVPNENQIEETEIYFSKRNIKTKIKAASPYLNINALNDVCSEFNDDVSIIFMNCMGFSSKMKNIVSENTGKLVILPRNIIFSLINQLA